jgi:hypothetical protein
MTWSEAKRKGLALAAVLWDDRDASAVSLVPELHAALRSTLAPLARANVESKTRVLRDWAACVRGDIRPSADLLPPRFRAQLARHVPRERGRRWLEDAAPTRAEFVLEASLLNSILHMARSPSAPPHAPTHPEE